MGKSSKVVQSIQQTDRLSDGLRLTIRGDIRKFVFYRRFSQVSMTSAINYRCCHF
jgi:hypothetical protein